MTDAILSREQVEALRDAVLYGHDPRLLTQAEARDLCDSHEALRARLDEAEKLLREVEQNSAETGQCCLVCDPNEETRAAPQHATDCKLSAFLAGSGVPTTQPKESP
jgi:hypothetical protein